MFHTTFSTLILISTYKNNQKTIDLPFIDKSTKSIDPEIPSLAFMLIGIKNINSSFMVIFMSCSMKSGTGLSSYFFISLSENPTSGTNFAETTGKFKHDGSGAPSHLTSLHFIKIDDEVNELNLIHHKSKTEELMMELEG